MVLLVHYITGERLWRPGEGTIIPDDPFVRLIIYLLLAAGAIWALHFALTQAKCPDPWRWVITLVIGLLLILLAFNMAGLPLFAMVSPYMPQPVVLMGMTIGVSEMS